MLQKQRAEREYFPLESTREEHVNNKEFLCQHSNLERFWTSSLSRKGVPAQLHPAPSQHVPGPVLRDGDRKSPPSGRHSSHCAWQGADGRNCCWGDVKRGEYKTAGTKNNP